MFLYKNLFFQYLLFFQSQSCLLESTATIFRQSAGYVQWFHVFGLEILEMLQNFSVFRQWRQHTCCWWYNWPWINRWHEQHWPRRDGVGHSFWQRGYHLSRCVRWVRLSQWLLRLCKSIICSCRNSSDHWAKRMVKYLPSLLLKFSLQP